MKTEAGGRSGSGGFTLIELLLAILITALIMVAVCGIVLTTVQAEERIEETTLGTELGPVILNQIRQDVEAAFLPDNTKDWFVGLDRQVSSGSRDRLDFVAGVMGFGSDDPQADPKFNSVNEVGYTADENRNHPGELILYRREDSFIDDDPLKGGHLTELYDRMLSFDVQYWNGKEWVVTWSSKSADNKLPRAVKVELILLVPDKTAEEGFAKRTYAITIVLPQ